MRACRLNEAVEIKEAVARLQMDHAAQTREKAASAEENLDGVVESKGDAESLGLPSMLRQLCNSRARVGMLSAIARLCSWEPAAGHLVLCEFKNQSGQKHRPSKGR